MTAVHPLMILTAFSIASVVVYLAVYALLSVASPARGSEDRG